MMLSWLANLQSSDWIAVCALVVSGFALAISMIELLSNKPKLRVQMSSAAASADRSAIRFTTTPRRFREDELKTYPIEMVSVDITNYGRQPTMIKTIEFKTPHNDRSVCPQPASPGENQGSNLPVELSPGQFRTFYFDANILVEGEKGANPIPLRDFVFHESVAISIRHAWHKEPQIFPQIHKT